MFHPAITILLQGTIIFLAGVMQSTVGFAFAVFATPLMLLIGVPITDTVIIVALNSLVQSTCGVQRLWPHVPWRFTTAAIPVRLAATAVGIIGLKRLAMLPLADIRFVVGMILCLLIAVQASLRVRPVSRLHPAWGALAFSLSGLLAGLTGMGGPPLVMWVMAHDWDSRKSRAFLFGVFMVTIPAQLAMLGLATGVAFVRPLATGLLLAPCAILGSIAGMPVGNRMPPDKLRRLAYTLLAVIGANAVLPRLLETALLLRQP